MGVAVPPSVPGARVDGGLDSRFRENDDRGCGTDVEARVEIVARGCGCGFGCAEE